jgi:hypothetical protein
MYQAPGYAAALQAPAYQAAPVAPAAAPAAPPQTSFPLQAPCARCRVTLEIPTVGKFKCPRCGAILAVEPTGRVRFFASKRGKPITISLPCNPQVAKNIADLAGKCAETVGFNGNSAEVISAAVVAACANVIERAYENDINNVFHMVIVPNGSSLTIKIADYGKAFDFGPGGSIHADSRFSAVVQAMDTVEHRINPRGGNVLTLIKVLQ